MCLHLCKLRYKTVKRMIIEDKAVYTPNDNKAVYTPNDKSIFQ